MFWIGLAVGVPLGLGLAIMLLAVIGWADLRADLRADFRDRSLVTVRGKGCRSSLDASAEHHQSTTVND
jgi:hypothetical protein